MTKKVEEFIAWFKGLSAEELRDLATTPDWAYLMHRLWKLRPGMS
jgi:hypothetical protein